MEPQNNKQTAHEMVILQLSISKQNQSSFYLQNDQISQTLQEVTYCNPTLKQSTPHFPELQLQLQLQMKLETIKEVFQDICSKQKFIVLEQDSKEQMLAINSRFQGWKYICYCLPYLFNATNQNVIQLQLQTDKKACRKLLVLKALYGNMEILNKFVQTFQNRMYSLAYNNNNNESVASNQNETIVQIYDDYDSQQQISVCLESYSYYHFYKVLCQDKYSLGMSCNKFIKEMVTKVEQNQIELNDMIRLLVQDIARTVDSFFMEHNYAKSETKQLMPFCHQSVEKYYFSFLGQSIDYLLNQRYQDEEQQFIEQRQKIQQQQQYYEQFEQLGISTKFRLFDRKKENNNPYYQACKDLKLSDQQVSGSEKLKKVMEGYNSMKISVVEYFKATEDVVTMDDELPLVIFIVANSENSRLLRDINFLYEYYQQVANCENEVRILTNFKVAVQYIKEEWQI